MNRNKSAEMILSPSNSCLQIATAKVKSSKSEENTAKLRLIHGFIAYSRLSCTIDRNIVLLDMAKSKLLDRNAKPPKKLLTGCRFEDVIKLHDIIIQSLMEMRDIPVLESDVVILEMILAKIFLYKAYR